MEGMKLVVGTIAAALILWLGLEGIDSFFQHGLTPGWWTIGAGSLLFVLWSIVHSAFWGSSNE